MENSFAFSLGVVLLVCGFVFAVFWGLILRGWLQRAAAAQKMAAATGDLRSIKLSARGARQAGWRLSADYSYRVGDRNYRGTRIGIGRDDDLYLTRKQAKAIEDRLPPGPVSVWYDPAAPQKSLLHRDPPGEVAVIKGILIAAATAAVAGTILIFVG